MIVSETVVTCCHEGCGISFAVPSRWEKNRREDKKWWYCPNGHAQHFTADTEAEKLRLERDRLKQQAARLEDEKREAWATANAQAERARKAEAATKRLKKRTAAGTCPCCQRSFSNMSTHMRKQHPDFVKDAGENVVPLKAKA